ncbi:hypothetical protein HWV62_34977 [Athelia sp. TMB]|nr:hypothetical protein HWV62_34977 [Athelia sp. TMB]
MGRLLRQHRQPCERLWERARSIDQPSSSPSPASTPATPTRAPADAERGEEDVPPRRARREHRRVPRLLPDGGSRFPAHLPRAPEHAPHADWLQVPQSPRAGSSMPAEANTPALRPPNLGITPTFWLPAHPPIRRPRSTWGRAPLAEGPGHGPLGAGGTDEGAGRG